MLVHMDVKAMRKLLSQAYDTGKLKLNMTEDERTTLEWSMCGWHTTHCSRSGIAEYTTEQYNKALKKRIINMCLNGTEYKIL
jgi:hypothetical protein